MRLNFLSVVSVVVASGRDDCEHSLTSVSGVVPAKSSFSLSGNSFVGRATALANGATWSQTGVVFGVGAPAYQTLLRQTGTAWSSTIVGETSGGAQILEYFVVPVYACDWSAGATNNLGSTSQVASGSIPNWPLNAAPCNGGQVQNYFAQVGAFTPPSY
jgi:hypothetical protein